MAGLPPLARQKTSHVPSFVPTGTRRQLNLLRRVLLVLLSWGGGGRAGLVETLGIGWGWGRLLFKWREIAYSGLYHCKRFARFFFPLLLYCRVYVCIAIGNILDGRREKESWRCLIWVRSGRTSSCIAEPTCLLLWPHSAECCLAGTLA